MTFEVTILGCSSARPTPTRHHTAHVLNVHEQFFLIDCGEGTQYQLMRYGINPQKINHVFISHLHGDHTYGIFGLLATMGMMGRQRPLTVFAPAPFREILESHFRYFSVVLPYELHVQEVDPARADRIFETRVFEVSTVPLHHRVPCCGYLFREKRPELNVRKEMIDFYGLDPLQIVALKRAETVELADGRRVDPGRATYLPYEPRSYAFCSDTALAEDVAQAVAGVDLLYHEATFTDEDRELARQTGHSTARPAGQQALRARAGHLLLGHYSCRYKDLQPLLAQAQQVFPRTILGADGMCVALDREHRLSVREK